MAISLLQSNHSHPTVGSTSVALAYTGNTTAGSLLVMGIEYGASAAGATTTVSGITGVTGGGTWANAVTQQHTANDQQGDIWYAPNATGGSTPTVTASCAGGDTFQAVTMWIAEFSGIATATPVDVKDATLAFAADVLTSNSVTVAGAGELILVHYVDTDGNQASISAGTGMTTGVVELGGTGTGSNGMCWKVGGSGSQNGGFTVGTSGHHSTVQIVAFLASGGGGPVPPPRLAAQPYRPY